MLFNIENTPKRKILCKSTTFFRKNMVLLKKKCIFAFAKCKIMLGVDWI